MKRYTITIIALLATLSVVAEGYIPTYVDGRVFKYVSHNGSYDEYCELYCSENSFECNTKEGYLSLFFPPEVTATRAVVDVWNHWIKEEDGLVLQYINLGESNRIDSLVQSYFTIIENDIVSFDYHLQQGDSMAVYCAHEWDNYGIYIGGKVITLLSKDTTYIDGVPHERYNLKSKPFELSINVNTNESADETQWDISAQKSYTQPEYEEAWIEGIGYTYWLFSTNTVPFQLISVKEGLKELYDITYTTTYIDGKRWIYGNDEMSIENTASITNEGRLEIESEQLPLHRMIEEGNSSIVARIDDERFPLLNKEYLLFDYNMQVGDTLCVYEGQATLYEDADITSCSVHGKKVKLIERSYVSVNGMMRRQYHFEAIPFVWKVDQTNDSTITEQLIYSDQPAFEETWIEGVGYTHLVYHAHTVYDSSVSSIILPLQSVEVNGQKLYGEMEYLPTYTDKREWYYSGVKVTSNMRTDGYADVTRLAFQKGVKEVDGKVIANLRRTIISQTLQPQDFFRYLTKYDDEHFVIFDYNMQVGDTINVFEGTIYMNVEPMISILGKTLQLESIDQVTIGNTMRLRYNFGARTCHWNIPFQEGYEEKFEYDLTYAAFREPWKTSWIEGIGYTHVVADWYTIAPLLELYDNGVKVYSGVNNTPALIEKSQQISRNGNLLTCDGMLSVYNMTGRIVAQGTTIDLATLPRGIYIVRYGNEVLKVSR